MNPRTNITKKPETSLETKGGKQMHEITIYCDRCGQKMEDTTDRLLVDKWTKHYYTYTKSGYAVYDLCSSCLKDFEIFLKSEPKEKPKKTK